MALRSFPPVLPDVSSTLPAWGGKVTAAVGLKMPDFARYDAMLGERVDDVASMCPDILPDRAWSGAERLHQVRPDLGRLAPRAEIVPIGSALAG